MTFEELRISYQCPERMARDLHAQLSEARAEITRFEAALSLAEAQRDKLKKKLAPPPARRTNRGEN